MAPCTTRHIHQSLNVTTSAGSKDTAGSGLAMDMEISLFLGSPNKRPALTSSMLIAQNSCADCGCTVFLIAAICSDLHEFVTLRKTAESLNNGWYELHAHVV